MKTELEKMQARYPYLADCDGFRAIIEAFSEEMLNEIEETIRLYEDTDLIEYNPETGDFSHKEGKKIFQSAIFWYEGMKATRDFVLEQGDKQEKYGYLLYQSTKRGDHGLFQQCLSNGADVNYQHWEFGFKPIHWAAYYAQMEMIQALADAGCDMNPLCETQNGHKTPLDLAEARHGYENVTELLLLLGAKRAKELEYKNSFFDANSVVDFSVLSFNEYDNTEVPLQFFFNYDLRKDRKQKLVASWGYDEVCDNIELCLDMFSKNDYKLEAVLTFEGEEQEWVDILETVTSVDKFMEIIKNTDTEAAREAYELYNNFETKKASLDEKVLAATGSIEGRKDVSGKTNDKECER